VFENTNHAKWPILAGLPRVARKKAQKKAQSPAAHPVLTARLRLGNELAETPRAGNKLSFAAGAFAETRREPR
jgi:hypothetical protein